VQILSKVSFFLPRFPVKGQSFDSSRNQIGFEMGDYSYCSDNGDGDCSTCICRFGYSGCGSTTPTRTGGGPGHGVAWATRTGGWKSSLFTLLVGMICIMS
jgi:hypothetical protein